MKAPAVFSDPDSGQKNRPPRFQISKQDKNGDKQVKRHAYQRKNDIQRSFYQKYSSFFREIRQIADNGAVAKHLLHSSGTVDIELRHVEVYGFPHFLKLFHPLFRVDILIRHQIDRVYLLHPDVVEGVFQRADHGNIPDILSFFLFICQNNTDDVQSPVSRPVHVLDHTRNVLLRGNEDNFLRKPAVPVPRKVKALDGLTYAKDHKQRDNRINDHIDSGIVLAGLGEKKNHDIQDHDQCYHPQRRQKFLSGRPLQIILPVQNQKINQKIRNQNSEKQRRVHTEPGVPVQLHRENDTDTEGQKKRSDQHQNIRDIHDIERSSSLCTHSCTTL